MDLEDDDLGQEGPGRLPRRERAPRLPHQGHGLEEPERVPRPLDLAGVGLQPQDKDLPHRFVNSALLDVSAQVHRLGCRRLLASQRPHQSLYALPGQRWEVEGDLDELLKIGIAVNGEVAPFAPVMDFDPPADNVSVQP